MPPLSPIGTARIIATNARGLPARQHRSGASNGVYRSRFARARRSPTSMVVR